MVILTCFLAGTTGLIEWTTTSVMTTKIPDDVPRFPSFFSTLVARRYAFDVKIVFGSRLGGKPMYLRVPVQVALAPVEKSPHGPLDFDFDFEEDLKAPAYVP